MWRACSNPAHRHSRLSHSPQDRYSGRTCRLGCSPRGVALGGGGQLMVPRASPASDRLRRWPAVTTNCQSLPSRSWVARLTSSARNRSPRRGSLLSPTAGTRAQLPLRRLKPTELPVPNHSLRARAPVTPPVGSPATSGHLAASVRPPRASAARYQAMTRRANKAALGADGGSRPCRGVSSAQGCASPATTARRTISALVREKAVAEGFVGTCFRSGPCLHPDPADKRFLST